MHMRLRREALVSMILLPLFPSGMSKEAVMEGRSTDMGGREKLGEEAGHALTTAGRRNSANSTTAPMVGILLDFRGSFFVAEAASECSNAAQLGFYRPRRQDCILRASVYIYYFSHILHKDSCGGRQNVARHFFVSDLRYFLFLHGDVAL